MLTPCTVGDGPTIPPAGVSFSEDPGRRPDGEAGTAMDCEMSPDGNAGPPDGWLSPLRRPHRARRPFGLRRTREERRCFWISLY